MPPALDSYDPNPFPTRPVGHDTHGIHIQLPPCPLPPTGLAILNPAPSGPPPYRPGHPNPKPCPLPPAGLDTLDTLLPAYVQLWLCGPSEACSSTGSSSSSPMDDAAQEARQRWRTERQKLLCMLGQQLGNLDEPLLAVW